MPNFNEIAEMTGSNALKLFIFHRIGTSLHLWIDFSIDSDVEAWIGFGSILRERIFLFRENDFYNRTSDLGDFAGGVDQGVWQGMRLNQAKTVFGGLGHRFKEDFGERTEN